MKDEIVVGNIYKLIGVDYYIRILVVPVDNDWLSEDQKRFKIESCEYSPLRALEAWELKGYILKTNIIHNYEFYMDADGIKQILDFEGTTSRLADIE